VALALRARASLELTVYSRKGCHLCEVMLAGLRTLQARYAFELRVVDIDTDATLYARYDEDVPVLVDGERELCRHRLDTARVEGHLASCGRIR
jgi:glutaredoxin